jgi:hypothetical protein
VRSRSIKKAGPLSHIAYDYIGGRGGSQTINYFWTLCSAALWRSLADRDKVFSSPSSYQDLEIEAGADPEHATCLLCLVKASQ